jgi:tripartite-type tricarboxylate transporter receptor subunit TctC
MKRLWLALSIGLVALAWHAGAASAQSYPNKPIRIIVPFAAGGTVDQLARIVGAKLSEAVGQSVVIENRAGVGGNAGADAVAKSPPDGYTILQNTNGQAIAPALYRSLPFDTAKDFIPVTQLVASQLMLVASTKLEAKTTSELIALAKAKPGSLNYGMTGIGNPLHLTMEMLKAATGIELQAIPYRGDAPLNTALIAGEVHLAVVPVATAKPNVEAGLIRALAVAGAKRIRTLPDVPTIAESGVPGFESSSWQGLFVPANTPKDVVLTIQREVAKVLALREVRERLEATGNEVMGSTPEEFDAKFKADLAKFAKVVKDARIPAQD